MILPRWYVAASSFELDRTLIEWVRPPHFYQLDLRSYQSKRTGSPNLRSDVQRAAARMPGHAGRYISVQIVTAAHSRSRAIGRGCLSAGSGLRTPGQTQKPGDRSWFVKQQPAGGAFENGSSRLKPVVRSVPGHPAQSTLGQERRVALNHCLQRKDFRWWRESRHGTCPNKRGKPGRGVYGRSDHGYRDVAYVANSHKNGRGR
jgi:hypothetical protein